MRVVVQIGKIIWTRVRGLGRYRIQGVWTRVRWTACARIRRGNVRDTRMCRRTCTAMNFQLIPHGTRMEANGDGAPFDISSSATRTFLCRLTITDQIEQESLDISIWGSPDGQNWGAKPLLKLPQQFYRGDTKMVLDLSLRSEIRFIRARWELNRWGRVAPTPMFVAGLDLNEIPPMSRETPTRRAALTAG